MLFDGIVYALFGKASTEGRNEENYEVILLMVNLDECRI